MLDRFMFLLVVFVLGYGGIVYGNASYGYVWLAESRGYSAGFVFALTAWAGPDRRRPLRPERP
jgi:hypothetical protein